MTSLDELAKTAHEACPCQEAPCFLSTTSQDTEGATCHCAFPKYGKPHWTITDCSWPGHAAIDALAAHVQKYEAFTKREQAEKVNDPYPDTEADGMVFCGKCGRKVCP